MVTRYELISQQVVKLFLSEFATFSNDKSKALMWIKWSKVLVYVLFYKNLPILAVFNLWITRSVRNKILWAPRYANVLFRCRHLSHESARCQNDNCRRSFPFHDVLILYISQESQDHGLHVDFDCFKLALWPTLRQKLVYEVLKLFDQEINMTKRSAIVLRLPSWSKLAILPWVSRS